MRPDSLAPRLQELQLDRSGSLSLPLVLAVLLAAGIFGCTVSFDAPDGEECGNGRIDRTEACDDGNLLSGDGCDETCMSEAGWTCFGQPSLCSTICGNGITSGMESCDDGNTEAEDGCSPTCAIEQGWQCVGQPSDCAPRCGDGLLAGEEKCDGDTMAVTSCFDLNLGGGALACLPNCELDLSDCEVQAECGNGQVEYPEVCDGNTLAGETCQSQGFQTGELACLPGCDGFDTSGCSGTCGDNEKNGAEVCDNSDLGEATCATLGFDGGALACAPDCASFDTSGCSGGTCGDGYLGSSEACDGANLAGHTCQSFGYYGGSLACAPDCSDFDLSGCSGTCGDGVIDPSEVCDSWSLGGETCQSQGYDAGSLGCSSNCASFDTSDCSYSCAINCGGPGCDNQPCGADGLVCQGGSCLCSGNGGAPQSAETACSDGYDNDCDGLIDCQDDQCSSAPCGANGLECLDGACQCTGDGGTPQASETYCNDSADNDCDGQIDCDDSSCAGAPCGLYGRLCSGGACVCSGNGGTPQSSETYCNDNADNDCDDLIDCEDNGCENRSCGAFGLTCSSGACICSGNGGTPQSSETYCNDNADNDCDGLVDCEDNSCEGTSCGANGLVCAGGSCVCSSGLSTESDCADAVDDDCDGLTDCADNDCSGRSCGANGMQCLGGSCTCSGNGGTPQIAEIHCDDNHDNDCDGLIDCEDIDCLDLPCDPYNAGYVCSFSGSCGPPN